MESIQKKSEKLILNCNENHDKQSATWTTKTTLALLKSYESKLEMIETPKKKTRIWIAISKELTGQNIDVTPDQVRWKINALTKKYKQAIDNGNQDKFQFFQEIDNIYAQYNIDCDYSIQNVALSNKKKKLNKIHFTEDRRSTYFKRSPESKSMIELRKLRLSNRIEADKCQSKINLEKQWLEYLKQQETHKKITDEVYDRSLKLREEELELRKKELEIKESLELRKIEIKEKELEELLQIERQKCELLKRIFTQNKKT